jgi:hypothetical protein
MTHGAWLETKSSRSELRAVGLRCADFCHGAHGRQVLREQARTLAPGANALDAERGLGQRREGKTGAEHLSATLPVVTRDLDHASHVRRSVR